MRSRRTLSIGLVVPNISNLFYSESTRLIERRAWAAGYEIFLCDSEGEAGREEGHLETLYQRLVDCVIIIHRGNKNLRKLVDPDSFCGSRYMTGHPPIVTDNELGGQLSMEHLVEPGHHRIGLLVVSAM